MISILPDSRWKPIRNIHGADASMKIYSMIETAKANELDPQKYLGFLLEHRPSVEMSDDELEQIAPWSNLAQETCK